ncbi:MAG: hypothetical protein Q9218_002417 [Villophora microphyllina]
MERYVFSTAAFPSVPSSELLTPFSDKAPPTSDLPEQFRATIAKLSTLSASLSPLPSDCSFTLVAELRDDADVQPPIRSDTPWIAAEPGLQTQRMRPGVAENGGERQNGTRKGKDLGGVKTTPIRNLESGAFMLEMWVEEGREKLDVQAISFLEIGDERECIRPSVGMSLKISLPKDKLYRGILTALKIANESSRRPSCPSRHHRDIPGSER